MPVEYVKSDGTIASQLSVGDNDVLDVNIIGGSIPAPVGGATSANQTLELAQLTSISTNTGRLPAQGQATMAASVPVAIASNQSAVPVSAASLPLPTGATTEATLSALSAKVTACNTGAVTVSSSALPTGAATETTLSTVNTSAAHPTTSSSITPSDATDLTGTVTKGLWVGTAGDVAVKLKTDSAAVVLKNVPSGTYIPGSYARVMATNTTATNIAGFGG